MKKMLALMILAAMPLFLTVEAKDSNSSCVDPCCPQPPVVKCDKVDPQFGYFYLTEEQEVEACFDTVSWANAGSVNTNGIFIDSSNPDRIILVKKGIYLATFTVTGTAIFISDANAAENVASVSGICCEKFQFALYLNEGEFPIPGSTYAGSTLSFPTQVTQTPGRGECSTEIVGQVIFRVNDKNSFLQLVNQSENNVDLNNEAGTNWVQKFGNNVSASIAIQRLSGLNID
ncbi:MAG: hypothetical protein LLG04_04610 [Parachlamydia sp.]|nr:hypothetical protein [Parachlamydia sp.]